MENINYIFFEEFKRLDKLCRDIYKSSHGVTDYIDDMKSVAWNHSRYIPNWNESLRQLITLRHIRNQLAHTEGAFYEILCTQQDINWLKDFYALILTQSDPMAQVYQIRNHIQAQQNSHKQRTEQSVNQSQKTNLHDKTNQSFPKKQKIKLPKIIIVLYLIAILFVLFVIGIKDLLI